MKYADDIVKYIVKVKNVNKYPLRELNIYFFYLNPNFR